MWLPKDHALVWHWDPSDIPGSGVGVLSLPLEQVDSSTPGIRIGILH